MPDTQSLPVVRPHSPSPGGSGADAATVLFADLIQPGSGGGGGGHDFFLSASAEPATPSRRETRRGDTRRVRRTQRPESRESIAHGGRREVNAGGTARAPEGVAASATLGSSGISGARDVSTSQSYTDKSQDRKMRERALAAQQWLSSPITRIMMPKRKRQEAEALIQHLAERLSPLDHLSHVPPVGSVVRLLVSNRHLRAQHGADVGAEGRVLTQSKEARHSDAVTVDWGRGGPVDCALDQLTLKQQQLPRSLTSYSLERPKVHKQNSRQAARSASQPIGHSALRQSRSGNTSAEVPPLEPTITSHTYLPLGG